MPWIGVSADGERVIPEEVPDGNRVTCPTCEEEMYPRGPTTGGKARHFVHNRRFSSCAGGVGGVSDLHRKWKSMVLSGLRQWFPEQIERSRPEATLDVERTTTPVEIRRADVHVEFDPEHPVLGEGLVVEVQHENRGMNRESVNHDYVVLGASVYWADESDFTDDRFRLHQMIEAFQTEQSGRRKAIVGSEASALQFEPDPSATSESMEASESTSTTGLNSLDEFEGMKHNPEFVGVPARDADGHVIPAIPDCNHAFSLIRAGRQADFECRECGLTFHGIKHPNHEGIYVNERGLDISTRYLNNAAVADKLEPDEVSHIPECDDRSWIRDDENGVYQCVLCEKEYPQDIDARRDQFTAS